jgi:hypothetical protein
MDLSIARWINDLDHTGGAASKFDDSNESSSHSNEVGLYFLFAYVPIRKEISILTGNV